MRYFESTIRGHMARRNLRDLGELAEAIGRAGPPPCGAFDAAFVRRSFRTAERAVVDRGYFRCLRGALGLTESETFDLIKAFYFGEGPYPL